MRCIAHIWNSLDCDGNQFLLCLSPLDSTTDGAPIEAFRNEKALSRRLSGMGIAAATINDTLSKLRHRKDITWTNIEIPEDAFEDFVNRLKIAS
jgi:hypothetical protein